MQEVSQSLPNSQAFTIEEKSAISHFVQDATSIFSRRIMTGTYLLEKLIPGVGKHLDWEAYADERHAYFSIFPRHEKSAMVERRRKFGTSFPGLYSIAGTPIGRDYGIGGVSVHKAENPIAVFGDGRGKSVLLTSCAFDIDRDTQFTICNLCIRSPKEKERRYNYRIYLLFIMTLGMEFDPFSISSALEDQVTRFFLESAVRKAVA